jgi:nitrogen regulatory protein P-II 1
MKKIEAIVRPSRLEALKEALFRAEIKGMTISEVHGCGNQHGWKEFYRGSAVIVNMLPKIKFEVVTTDERVPELVKLISETAQTGQVGDGKIFVIPVDEVIRIRTNEEGEVAI